MAFRQLLPVLGISGLVMVFPLSAQPIQLDDAGCERGVTVETAGADIQVVLEALSDELGFELLKSPKVSKSVSVSGTYPQEELLRKILSGTSHFLSQAPSDACPGQLAVREVILLAPGETVMGPGLQKYLPKVSNGHQKDYKQIADMKTYVREVLNKERRSEMARLTPEQRAEFMRLKKQERRSHDFD